MHHFYRVFFLVIFTFVITMTSVFAQTSNRNSRNRPDPAYLDPPYPRNIPRGARIAPRTRGVNGLRGPFAPKSNTLALLQMQTPVRSQSARGTCSIFSSTALTEFLVAKKTGARTVQLDLSEEWLSYVLQTEGSSAYNNFRGFARYGSPREEAYPYIGEGWKTLQFSSVAQERCGKVPQQFLAGCLAGHRDPRLLGAQVSQLQDPKNELYNPEFLRVRDEATDLRNRVGMDKMTARQISDEATIKSLLAQGIPLIMEGDFFYGAWNHGKADSLGIGRDPVAYAKGLVGYPEHDSMDYQVSTQNYAGHSVLAVGYDDNFIMETHQKMKDGSVQTFTYKGVIYFKNSWGTGSFGVQMVIDGQPAPGYGAMTEKYAFEHLSFYQAVLP